MSFAEYRRMKDKAKKGKKEAGAMTIGGCMIPFILASLYYIVVLGAAV